MKKKSFLLLTGILFFLPFYWKSLGIKLFAQYPSQNISLLSHWDTAKTINESIYNIRYSSVWGWVHPQNNKEYAIIGASDGTYFIEVTIPTAPVVCAFVAGRRDSCIWREYKTYQNYLYAVSDDGVNANNQNSLQIIDMSGLPNSVQVVYDQDTLIQRAHTLFIDGDKMYCGSVLMPNHNGHSNMSVYSLANPTTPVLLRRLEQDYPSNDNVHDMYVRNNTCYASSSNSGMFIYKFNSAANTLSQAGALPQYANFGQGYNHSSALTANGKTLIFTDEVPANLAVKALDVSDFNNLSIVDTFRSTPTTGATPHNPYIKNGDNSHTIIAYYQDGLQIFDISNPANIIRTGFFDTAPANCPTCPNPNYSGCWGAYVNLPSGIILASDMQAGLFVFDATAALGVPKIPDGVSITVSPNPFTTTFQLNFSLRSGEDFLCEISDITGKLVMRKQFAVPAGQTPVTVDGKSLSTGAYMLTLKSDDFSITKKIIKANK